MMWRWRSNDREGGSLIRRFAVLSFVVIGATTLALSFVIATSLERDMLAREWQVTGTYVLLEASRFLTPADFASSRTPEAQARFRAFYQQMMRVPETMRVKVFDRSMTIIWSDEPRLIGQRFPDNPQLLQALEGETVAHLETKPTKTENVFEERKRFVELYVPLAFETAGVVGIAEVYKAPDGVFANIDRARRIVVGMSLAGGVLLWASLYGIVRAASRRIERQNRDLATRGRELAEANDELRSVHAQLVAAERMAAIGEVVAAVAHGIRNPLANVRASAQLALLDCRTCSPVAAAVPNITNAISEVDRLAARVRDLLQFVRPAERLSEDVDLNDVVAETLRMTKEKLATGSIRVVERLDAGLPTIVADFALLEQAFGALVENAVDAMPAEGELTLTTGVTLDADDRAHVFLDVQDTGPGVPPAAAAKIFDLFYTTKSQGTGLGLALARKFVEAYGGTLTLMSAPGQGARFRAAFPVAEG